MSFDPFSRRHGSLYDRGQSDSWYRRPRQAHYGGVGEDTGPKTFIFDEDLAAQAEYNAGYDDNEVSGEHKEWG